MHPTVELKRELQRQQGLGVDMRVMSGIGWTLAVPPVDGKVYANR